VRRCASVRLAHDCANEISYVSVRDWYRRLRMGIRHCSYRRLNCLDLGIRIDIILRRKHWQPYPKWHTRNVCAGTAMQQLHVVCLYTCVYPLIYHCARIRLTSRVLQRWRDVHDLLEAGHGRGSDLVLFPFRSPLRITIPSANIRLVLLSTCMLEPVCQICTFFDSAIYRANVS
jgi:hypothetical protein